MGRRNSIIEKGKTKLILVFLNAVLHIHHRSAYLCCSFSETCDWRVLSFPPLLLFLLEELLKLAYSNGKGI